MTSNEEPAPSLGRWEENGKIEEWEAPALSNVSTTELKLKPSVPYKYRPIDFHFQWRGTPPKEVPKYRSVGEQHL
jgi:hypothetical protein